MGFIQDMLTKHREAILYLVFGGFTTLVSWFSYAAFVWVGLELNVSNILSWFCAVLFAFVVNKWFVFESKSLENKTVAKEIVLFFGARIFTGVLSWILFPILLWIGLDQTLLGTEGLIAKIIVTIVEIALNWVFSKYMIFKKKEQTA
jgi:putative flippase GtrA